MKLFANAVLVLDAISSTAFAVAMIFFREWFFGLMYGTADAVKFEGHAAVMEVFVGWSMLAWSVAEHIVIFTLFGGHKKKGAKECSCKDTYMLAVPWLWIKTFVFFIYAMACWYIDKQGLKLAPNMLEALMLFNLILAALNAIALFLECKAAHVACKDKDKDKDKDQ